MHPRSEQHELHHGLLPAAEVSMAGGAIEVTTQSGLAAYEVTLAPVVLGDTVAEELIRRATITTAGGSLQVELPTGGAAVRVTLRVPTGTELAVDTGGASVTTNGSLGMVSGRTRGGTVRLDATSRAYLHTDGGSVAASFLCLGEITTGGGLLSLATVTGPTTLVSGGGSVTVGDLRDRAQITTGGGNLRTHVTTNALVHLRTSGGAATVTHPRGLTAAIDLVTSGGHKSLGLSA